MENQTNYAGCISTAYITQNKSSKTGNEYTTLDITFKNGYKQRVFLGDAEKFAIKDSASLMDANRQIDDNFRV